MLFYIPFLFFLSLGDLPDQIFIKIGHKEFKAQVLKLGPQPSDTEPVCKRRINFECLGGYPLLLVFRKVLEGTHVVEPVGKFYKYNPDVFGHGKEHLAEVFGLGLFCPEFHLGELCEGLDDKRDLLAENPFYVGNMVNGIFL